MKYIFKVTDKVVIDSQLFKDCDSAEKAWELLDLGFGRLLDRDVSLDKEEGTE